MKHQIALVGGQVLPIFLGVKEYCPDRVHFIVTNESNTKLEYLCDALDGLEISSYVCNPYDVNEIKNICETIINQCSEGDEVNFNLTGGTKLMLIAAQAVLSENGLNGFYVNIGNVVTHIPSFTQSNLAYKISTEDFLKLSGHIISSSRSLESYTKADLEVAKAIQLFSDEGQLFSLITQNFRENKNKKKKNGEEVVNKQYAYSWCPGKVTVKNAGEKDRIFESQDAKGLFFYGGWWELLVASALSRWDSSQEILMGLTFPFKSDLKISKNEVDVLINRNNKLIFVECKSGVVMAQDINKINAIRDIYGGNASKSILVCQHKPDRKLFEKCKEFSIEVFYMIGEVPGDVRSFEELIADLNLLDKKLSL